MSIDAWITISVVLLLLVALVRNLGPPDLLFLGGATFLAFVGIITPAEAFAGFANSGMLTVAALFVVAAAMRETGLLYYFGEFVLGKAQSEAAALRRLAVAVMPMSAFMNNTPIVAMCMPMVHDWCRRHQVSPSKLLIPLSYFAILGGVCTLIGTSTNLLVHGMLLDQGLEGMSLFEISLIGIPYAAIGLIYIFLIGRRLLPDRKDLLEQLGENLREYLVEMSVEPGSRLVGLRVDDAGLRQLPGLYLTELERDGESISPVAPDQLLQGDDRLVFSGVVGSIIELEKIPGLRPFVDPQYSELSKERSRRLCEAVISRSSPLVGISVRDADFRAAYGAAVLAVHRGGSRIDQKIGDIQLRHGDTLLLQTGSHFARAHRNDPSFTLISTVDEWRPVRRERAWLSLGLFAFLLVLMASGSVDIVTAAMFTAFLVVAGRCISAGDARRSIEWPVLITIAAALGIGNALFTSGAAASIALYLVDFTQPFGPLAALVAMYLICWILTELITNNAAAALMFPFCLETARLYGVSERPFVIAIVLAASASFTTPIGYQTNMMVYGPGGYRFSDFVKVGLPLNLVLLIVGAVIIPFIWPF